MNKLIFSTILIIIVNLTFADNYYTVDNPKAIEYFNTAQTEINVNADYDAGLKYLQLALKEEPCFIEAIMATIETYELKREYNSVIKVCKSLNECNNDDDKYKLISHYKLANAYFLLGNYEEAQKRYSILQRVDPNNLAKINKRLEDINYALNHLAHKSGIKQTVVENINTKGNDEFSPTLIVGGQTILFTRRSALLNRDIHNDIYFSNNENGYWSAPAPISRNINTKGDEGYPSITSDGKTMFFSSTQRDANFGPEDIYFSTRSAKGWSEPVNLGRDVNSESRDFQPSISADGNTLYFVSTREEGLGGTDIWMTQKDDDGDWSDPKNLGDKVNSPKDEYAPFIHFDNKHLYFSTNGRKGMGGFDIFVSETETGENWSDAKNMGSPINKGGDQFKLFVSADGKTAYQSLENPLNNSKDIYKFNLPKDLQITLSENLQNKYNDIASSFFNLRKKNYKNSINTIINPNIVLNISVQDSISNNKILDAKVTISYINKIFAEGNISIINLDSSNFYDIKIERHGYDTLIIKKFASKIDAKIDAKLIRNSKYVADQPNVVYVDRIDTVFQQVAMINSTPETPTKPIIVAQTNIPKVNKTSAPTKTINKTTTVNQPITKQPVIKQAKVIPTVIPESKNKINFLLSKNKFSTHTIYYKMNKYIPSEEYSKIIEAIIIELKNNTNLFCLITGYTDKYGSKKINMRVSQYRANYIKNMLIKGGIERRRISYNFHGKQNLEFKEDQKNRRTDIIIF